jgi:uncharacterized protein YbaR (Trm112 family)
MKREFLDLLACPACRGERLTLTERRADGPEVDDGAITCDGCRATYPVVRGIPRMLTGADRGVGHQSRVYSYYHSLHSKEGTFLPEAHQEIMINTLRLTAPELRGKTVLDAGCGIGRYTSALSSLAADGLVVAMDLSQGVEQARQNLIDHRNCFFIQGDVTQPPFRSGCFDAVVSWGVIHHTPCVRRAFARLSELVKEDGRLGIFVYEFHPIFTSQNWPLLLAALLRQYLAIKPLRFICTRLPLGAVEAVSTLARLSARTVRFDPLGVASGPPGDRFNAATWRRVFIDRFHTRFASEHSCQEVLSWFYEEGFDDLEVPAGCPPVTVSGRKARSLNGTRTISAGRSMIPGAGA